MLVSTILGHKGKQVFTIRGDQTALEAAKSMTAHGVGALVVSADGQSVDGIVSERDMVRHFAARGAEVLGLPVSELMTAVVSTCKPETTVDELTAIMTELRIRHVPVLVDGALAGIVSIGDAVKSRLDELEVQAEALEGYVTGSHT